MPRCSRWRKDRLPLRPNLEVIADYVSNIFTKLQVADRAQVIIRAREAELVYEGP